MPGREFTYLIFKQEVLETPDPNIYTLENWITSMLTTGHIV